MATEDSVEHRCSFMKGVCSVEGVKEINSIKGEMKMLSSSVNRMKHENEQCIKDLRGEIKKLTKLLGEIKLSPPECRLGHIASDCSRQSSMFANRNTLDNAEIVNIRSYGGDQTGNLPIVKVNINGNMWHLLYDTGSQVSIIDSEKCKVLKENWDDALKTLRIVSVTGHEQTLTRVKTCRVGSENGTVLGEIRFWLMSLGDKGYDGILGINDIRRLNIQLPPVRECCNMISVKPEDHEYVDLSCIASAHRPMVSSSLDKKSVRRIENGAVKLPPTEFNRNCNSAKRLMNPRPPYTKSFDRGDLVMLAVPKTEGYSNVYGPFRVEARVSDVNFRAYADDLVVVISGLRHGQLSKAQHAIDLITNWCGLHKLELSVNKCQAMFVQKPRGRIRMLRRDLISNGQVVQWSDSIRVLGMRFDSRLTFHQHVTEVCSKVRGMLPRLSAAANFNFGFGFRALRMLYLQGIGVKTELYLKKYGYVDAEFPVEPPPTPQPLPYPPFFFLPSDIPELPPEVTYYTDGSKTNDGVGAGPSACSSKLGWILSGNVSSSETGNSYISLCSTSQGDDNLRKFFELESVPAALPLTKEEKSCGDIYDKNFCISTDGRYSVGLPFKSVPNLGDSRQNAMKRFLALERKLHKSSNLLHQYKDFMMEYLSLNHMELIPKNERDKPSDKCYFIPHHCVLREQISTTKLRVVFDASCKTSNNYSLNEFLHTGPKLQHDIFNILVKFRTNPIAFTGDIEKMYRKIKVNSSDLDFQRIIWRNSPLESLLEYRFLTVTYGMSCAPYLAIRTLIQLATDKELLFPEASKIIKTDFYVDDLLSGATTIEEAKVLIDDIRKIFFSGGFCIRKWMSNVPEVFSEVPEALKAHDSYDIGDNSSVKILGINWNPSTDNLTITVNSLKVVYSKRQLLSDISRIYDPLGWLSPVIISFKILFQTL
ncbi:hypothetical protein LAZ67_6003257 [Cordylochernes scorpioides]|uniref:Reverse transcriptase domain-containing protein n=1 Tax=Cordylochernes scorpioides TaxID=51811 RepID=A0ABY6KQE3_9ARAC|nr:hypothetical protein LAZ67_6003257 [Cordylochernes scorpioides]